MYRVLLTVSTPGNETQVISLRVVVVQPTDDIEMLHYVFSALCRSPALVMGLL
jgi:hypothetical protein